MAWALSARIFMCSPEPRVYPRLPVPDPAAGATASTASRRRATYPPTHTAANRLQFQQLQSQEHTRQRCNQESAPYEERAAAVTGHESVDTARPPGRRSTSTRYTSASSEC